jgi:hippurate hydrolase
MLAVKRAVDEAVLARMVEIRRDLHRHPELSWQEERTAARVAERLAELGVEARRLCGTGLVADLGTADGGPRVALRADLDALPIQEETGLEFASVHDGVMHACGHDGHAAMLLGAAELLTRERELPAPVRLIFQPAEERGAGAEAMVEAGVLDGVALIFGGHLDRHFPTGCLVAADGPVNASTDGFRVAIRGQGGHAARPHEAIDAVVVGSLIVMSIQTIVSREVDPAHPSVVTVGRFDAGTAGNVIAGQALLEGTVRAQDQSVREHLLRSIRRVVESVGQLHQANVEVEMFEGTPRLVNVPEAAKLARRAAHRVAGGEAEVRDTAPVNMGGEDFAYYLQRVPGCYIRFGAQVAGREGYPAHSSRFDFDEQALAWGAAWFHKVALAAGRDLRRRATVEGGATAGGGS